MTKDELMEDPGYLDELVEEGRIERDGETWGVDAPRAEQIVAAETDDVSDAEASAKFSGSSATV